MAFKKMMRAKLASRKMNHPFYGAAKVSARLFNFLLVTEIVGNCFELFLFHHLDTHLTYCSQKLLFFVVNQ
jgi:hypothetical protein